MKVVDYEYPGKLDEDIILTEQRKSELIKKIKDQVTKNGIALHKILRTGKNDVEYDFIYDYSALPMYIFGRAFLFLFCVSHRAKIFMKGQ